MTITIFTVSRSSLLHYISNHPVYRILLVESIAVLVVNSKYKLVLTDLVISCMNELLVEEVCSYGLH